MKIMDFKIFRCILKLIRNFILGVEIITIGLGLCLKNIFHLFYLACLTLMAMACYVYFLTVFASIIIAGLGALIMGFVFVLKLFSLKKGMSKYTISNSFIHFIVFKTDWVNVHMMAIAKIILIYFINFKNIGGCELNILFIFFTLFYTALLFVCSDFVIQIMFNIQQGVFTIAKGLENWNINNCKDNEENNTNINNVNNVNGTGDQGTFSSLDEKIIFPNLNISGILSDTGIIGTGDLYGGGKSQLNSKGTQGVGIVGLFSSVPNIFGKQMIGIKLNLYNFGNGRSYSTGSNGNVMGMGKGKGKGKDRLNSNDFEMFFNNDQSVNISTNIKKIKKSDSIELNKNQNLNNVKKEDISLLKDIKKDILVNINLIEI